MSSLSPLDAEACPAGCGTALQVYEEEGQLYYVLTPARSGACPLTAGCAALSALRRAQAAGPLMIGPYLPPPGRGDPA